MARKRKYYSAEFKADAVRLVGDGKQTMTSVAESLGVHLSTLAEWVKRAKVDAGQGAPGELTTTEKRELTELRRRVKQLEMEKAILKKAAAFFAKESE